MKKLFLAVLLTLSMSGSTEPTTPMGSKCYGWAPRCSFGQELVCLCDSYGFDCRFVCIDKY
jgi:hypothetical protein